MGVSAQPPRPPIQPPPPRPRSHILAIALLLLALIVLVSTVAVLVGLRFLSRSVQLRVEESQDGKKGISIRTPLGSLEVNKGVTEAGLGLPVYPGAKSLKDQGSASVNLDFPNDQGVRVRVAKYETPDSLEKVRDFYKHRLGSEVTKYREKDPEGKTVFEIKQGGQAKIVALKRRGPGTEIDLVHVIHGADTTN